MPSDTLKKQLERTRFERALQASESLADRRALLTTAELSRLNAILTGLAGKNAEDESRIWRTAPVTLTLPSGKTETLALVADPKQMAREKLHRATEAAEAGAVIDAAVGIYAGLVMSHVFQDANRRTAVLAAHYFLRRYGIPVSGLALHEIGLGDLREEGQLEALRETIGQMAKFAAKQRLR
ncbi:MAG: Fic family protein [Oligoflexia bacterium]|nr:Fic family protein [Oligoflexia bacterium]